MKNMWKAISNFPLKGGFAKQRTDEARALTILVMLITVNI